MLRADFHCHTFHSPDAATTPAELVERAAECGIDRIAVTDHGEIEGALVAQQLDPERVIVGEEIRCAGGTELIGLYLRERIAYGLSVQETAERIRDQGGLVYAPHPFAYAWQAARHAAEAIAVADVVEAFNSRAFLPAWNRRALRHARTRGLPVAASSDGHFPYEIGRAYTELPWFDSAATLRAALTAATPVGLRTATPLIHLASITLKLARLSAGRLAPGHATTYPSPYRPTPQSTH